MWDATFWCPAGFLKVNHNNVKVPLIKTDSPLINNVLNRFRHPWFIIWKNLINLLEIIKSLLKFMYEVTVSASSSKSEQNSVNMSWSLYM